ncbi:MAG: cation transporter, partial [Eubacterium sp.]|nr:cation transporter [Eubacterium sp.]
MTKTYEIEVDCANCSNLMEDAANKSEGVLSATVNFMMQKMTVEFEENAN